MLQSLLTGGEGRPVVGLRYHGTWSIRVRWKAKEFEGMPWRVQRQEAYHGTTVALSGAIEAK